MNGFSKLSLYDFLAMMIPGFIIMWFFHFLNIDPESPTNDILIAILCYLTGLCYHKFIEFIATKFHIRRNKYMQEKTWKQFYKQINNENEYPHDIDDKFVSSYYLVAKNGCLMNIPVLEAQETFLRNSIPLLLISIPYICCRFSNLKQLCCICILLLVLVIGSILCWISINKKIYFLVWEGEYYLNTNNNPSSGRQNTKAITDNSLTINKNNNETTDN